MNGKELLKDKLYQIDGKDYTLHELEHCPFCEKNSMDIVSIDEPSYRPFMVRPGFEDKETIPGLLVMQCRNCGITVTYIITKIKQNGRNMF